MDRKGKPPNLQLGDKVSQKLDAKPKPFKQGIHFRRQKNREWEDFKEWKAVSHSVSILFNGKTYLLLLFSVLLIGILLMVFSLLSLHFSMCHSSPVVVEKT